MAIEPRKFEALWHKPQRDWEPFEALGVLEEIDRLQAANDAMAKTIDSLTGMQPQAENVLLRRALQPLADADPEGNPPPIQWINEARRVLGMELKSNG